MGDRLMKKTGIAVLVAVMAAIAVMPTASAFASHEEPCADVTLVWARGSGSAPDGREARKFYASVDGRLGESVQVNKYELGTGSHGPMYSAVGIGLSSLQSFKNMIEADASWTGVAGGKYRESVATGVSELVSYLGGRAPRCPDEQFVLGGYSQGAQVVGDALPGLPRSILDRIAFVALFGDPKLYLPEGRGPFPPACRGKEFSAWRRGSVSCFTDNGIFDARKPYLPSEIADRTGSWCDRNDVICNGNIEDLRKSDHSQYADEGAEIDEASREIALALERRLPSKAADIDTSILIIGVGTAGLDVAFVIDTTGSMSGRIGAARSIAEAAGERIVGLRGRVALTEYKDYGDEFVSRIVTPFTTDIDALRGGLNGLSATGGGDTPEALLHALMTTFDGLGWTPGATKAAVVLTDAGYHDPDLAGGFTRADIVARALEIDPVNVYPVVDSSIAAAYQPLAHDTVGRVILDTGDTASALLAAISEIERRPIALLASAEYIAAPGDEVVFDASTSYDPDANLTSFEWDFDGDGTIDHTTAEPRATHTYTSPHKGLVEVRVHSSDGGVANAVASVRIDDAGLKTLIPDAPTNLKADEGAQDGGRRTVTLSWDPPASGAPIGGWVISNGAGELLARRPAGTTAASIADVPADPTTFSVAASNEFGIGPAATTSIAASSPSSPTGGASNDVGGPAGTPTAHAPKAAKPKVCKSRRYIQIRLFAPRRATSATIRLSKGRPQIIRGRALRRPVRIDLRGLPRGTFKVKITYRKGGKRISQRSRRYSTCVKKRP